LSYAPATNTVTDYVWFYESNIGVYFSFVLPEGVDTPYESVKGDAYIWDSATKSATKAEEQISELVLIDGNVVTFPNFLNSGKEFVVTIYDDGSAVHQYENGDLEGTFTIGEFGSRENLYLYAGKWDYNDFDYYVSEGVKTLHFGAYAGSDWFDLYFYLPDSFEPAEPIDPYADYDTFQLPVTIGEDTIEFRSFIEDGALNIIGLFGNKSLAKYYFGEDKAITSNLKVNWYSTDYTYNEVENSYLYFYAQQYLSYAPATNTVTDYVWFYESNIGVYFSFVLPEGVNTPYTTISGDVYIWDSTTNSATKSEQQISDVVLIENGVITFVNFLGSGQEFIVSVTKDGAGTHQYENGTVEGTYSFGEYGKFDSLYLYAGKWSYNDFNYYIEEGVKILHLGVYAYLDGASTWFDVYYALPEDFEPYDPYADYEHVNVPVSVYDQDDYYKNGAAATVVDSFETEAVIDGDNIVLTEIFGASNIIYTIAEDGTVTNNINGWVSSDYTYNEVKNTWVYSYGAEYITFDGPNAILTDYLWLNDTKAGIYFSIQLPDSYKRETTNVANIAVDSAESNVEYFNLQGVRVANPANGIFIRRVGSSVQKVLVK
jgi:hypothetical protein